MTHSKRFTLLFAIAVLAFTALVFTPAVYAGDDVAAPSAFEVLLQTIADIFLPAAETPSAEPGEESNAGPNIIFIG